MEKFQKAYDGLKSGGTLKKKDVGLLPKDKIGYCQAITEALLSQQFKQHPDFAKQFSAAFEILFTLCDDPSSDVRVYVDECLNSIIRSNLSEGNATRIHCELYQEIKRNGPARCLRAAMSKFADLTHQIRPNRCRTFAKNMLSAFVAVIRRPEESVQECLGSVVEKILSVLGRFFSDEETKILIKSILPNLQLQSAASRRTAAVFLVELCKNSRKRYTFVSYLFKALLDTLVPVQFDQSVLQLLGTFFTLRQLIPVLKICEDEDDAGHELRVTQTGTIKLRPSTSLTTEQMLQFYEAIVYYLNYPHSSVVTAALETLNQLLLFAPKALLQMLLSETDTMGKSRVFFTGSTLSRSRKGSFSGMQSGVSSLGGSQSDLTALIVGDLSIDEPNLFPGAPDFTSPVPPTIPATPSNATDDDTPLSMVATPNMGRDIEEDYDQPYSSMQMGELVDDDSVPASTSTTLERTEKKKLARQLTPLNFVENAADTEQMLSDSISPMSPQLLRENGIPDDIGSFGDSRPPIRYCGRLLCRKFLLSGVIGELIPDKDVRVSHKVLALTCLDALCNLYPNILDDVVFPYSGESQRISDVLLFANHDDPQIKGNIATLSSSWLKSATICTGHKVEALSQQIACEVVRVLSKTLADESGIAARMAVAALTKCYGELLQYDVETCLQLLRQAVALARNSYWLLKVEVAELLSTVDYCAISAAELSATLAAVGEEEKFYHAAIETLINVLLADEDFRVRHSSSTGLVSVVDKLCVDASPDETAFVRRCDKLSSDFDFSWHLRGFPPLHCLTPSYKFNKDGGHRRSTSSTTYVEENLSYLIDRLVKALNQAKDKNQTIGCLTALQKLAEAFPPSAFGSAWCITSGAKAKSSIDLLSMLLSVLRSVAFGTDTLGVHQALFSLIGSLFAGAALRDLSMARNQKKDTALQSNVRWPALTSAELGEFANDLFNYCLRTISIYWHAVTEQQPAPPPVLTKPPLPQLPQAASLTPMANKLKAVTGSKSEVKIQDKNDANATPNPPALSSTKYKAADFYSSVHLMRVFDMVKGAWSNYKISLDADVEEKFCFLLRSCLECLNSLLEVASISDVERMTEELLAYLKPLMPILPAEVVTTVIQLLKSLFGTNLPMLFLASQSLPLASFPAMQAITKSMYANNEPSVFQSCVTKQKTKFYNQISAAAARHDLCGDALKRHLGWFGTRGERHVMSLLKNATNKATLTNYIRLFEPIVVQGLRLYTSCVSVELQCGVIGLLSQLIQIRVNYSLLDTDRRFLEFLFQQLENIEDGHMRHAEALTRKLFEFFVLLSYEKYQSKSVVEVPRILQLAKSLLASSHNGKSTGLLGALALHPVVLDLYFFRSASKVEAVKELEIQQEVVASMLIKCIQCGSEPLSLLSLILYQTRKENESKWRKLSRDIVDAFLPSLARNQIMLRNSVDLSAIFVLADFLCSSAFRPADSILSLMLTPPQNGITVEEFCSWLACQIWCLRSLILYSNEAAIASRLEEMPSAVVGATWLIGKGCDTSFVDPLGSTLQMNAEEIIARLVISVIKNMLERLGESLVTQPISPTLGYLEQLCHYYATMILHICHCGEYPKFTTSFAQLLQSGLVNLDVCIARASPELALVWFNLLAAARADEVQCWKLVTEYGINSILRRCVTMLICDRLKEWRQLHDGSFEIEPFLSANLDIFEWFSEPPVKDFLSVALKQPRTCGDVLQKLSHLLIEDQLLKPNRAIKLLQCLEVANFDASATVLDIATRFMSKCNQLSVAKVAGTLALRKLDILMVNRVEDTKTMLSFDVLKTLISRFDASRKRRFGVLYGRLEQLIRNWYPNEYVQVTNLAQNVDDQDAVGLMEQHAMQPSLLPSPAKFNRVKFLDFLQSVLRTKKGNTRFCAEALCSLTVEDVSEILVDERTTPRLLVACLSLDDKESLRNGVRAQSPSGGRCKTTEIADAARRSLLGAIRTAMGSVPKDFKAVFTSLDYSVVGDCAISTSDRILSLMAGVEALFKNTRLKSTLTETELRLLVTYLSVAMTVILKRLDSIRLSHGHHLVNVFVSALRNEHFCRVLASTDFIEHQLHLLGGSFWLCHKALKLKELKNFVDELPVDVNDNGLRVAWQYCVAFLRWIESRRAKPFGSCGRVARSLFVGLCRLPSVTSFTHIPPSAFKFGWKPELRSTANGYSALPTVPVHHLQDVDTLREFIFRVNTLGWSSRQQFEEIWMGLLGVLSATTIGKELLSNSVQETEERIVASSYAVRCLSSLLLQTLLSPTPGNPLASEYVLKPREKQSTFLRTTFGLKLSELRRLLRRQIDDDRNDMLPFGFNPERLLDRGQYSMGQLSVETLWSLTGILAEERDLVSALPRSPIARRLNSPRVSEAYEAGMSVDEDGKSSRGTSFISYTDEPTPAIQGKTPEEFMAVRRSTSNFLLISESGLDLVSCLHFLLDLFTHWFAGGPDDIPLVLLSATIETVLYLSDLFTERSQYVWLRERLLSVYQTRLVDDELMLQDVLLGLLKCSAVLGMNDVEKQKEAAIFMEVGLHNPQLSVRMATVHGVLYLLQALTSDETISLMPSLTDYVMPHISIVLNGDLARNLEKPQSLEHQLAVWALGFYIAEAFHDPHTKTSFAPKFIELCCKALKSDTISIVLMDSVINGLESLLVSTPVDSRIVAQLTRLATERVQKPSSPQAAVLSMELLLTCLYASKEHRRFGDASTPDSEVAPRVAGEPHISAMERLTVLLNRITDGSRFEASAIGSVLPDFLADHFSPSDVMNKVIFELLNPMQPHPQVLIRALHSLIEALLQQEVPTVVCDWVLVSLPSFTCKNPAHFSIWALTCLLVDASTNPWVKALWPLAMSRYNACESALDWRLFCFAILAFHSQLNEPSQVDTLIKTIAKAAERHPNSAYARAQEYLFNAQKQVDVICVTESSDDKDGVVL